MIVMMMMMIMVLIQLFKESVFTELTEDKKPKEQMIGFVPQPKNNIEIALTFGQQLLCKSAGMDFLIAQCWSKHLTVNSVLSLKRTLPGFIGQGKLVTSTPFGQN